MRTSFNIFNLIITIYQMTQCHAKILRNNALMSKMVLDFHKDNNLSGDQPPEHSPLKPELKPEPSRVLNLMQNVLCRNFPSIPCDIITQDKTLKKLIQKSIQQINYKKLAINKTTPPPGFDLTLFPVVNSEDISNFLQVKNTGYFEEPKQETKRRKVKKNITTNKAKKYWIPEKHSTKLKKEKESKRTSLGRKKIRKFYPHKTKYKDKIGKQPKNREFGEYSEEKLSMSVEMPDAVSRGQQHLNYKAQSSDSPVWRIDYMKHGEPSLNMFAYDNHDSLKGKIMKTGPSVVVDEHILEHANRKDVLHPDVYIKKSLVRKNIVDLNSEGIE